MSVWFARGLKATEFGLVLVMLLRIRVGVSIYTMRTSHCGRVRLLRLLLLCGENRSANLTRT